MKGPGVDAPLANTALRFVVQPMDTQGQQIQQEEWKLEVKWLYNNKNAAQLVDYRVEVMRGFYVITYTEKRSARFDLHVMISGAHVPGDMDLDFDGKSKPEMDLNVKHKKADVDVDIKSPFSTLTPYAGFDVDTDGKWNIKSLRNKFEVKEEPQKAPVIPKSNRPKPPSITAHLKVDTDAKHKAGGDLDIDVKGKGHAIKSPTFGKPDIDEKNKGKSDWILISMWNIKDLL